MAGAPTTVRRIETADFASVLDLLQRAFDDDPWFNFVATNDELRVARMRRWLERALVRNTYPLGEVFVTDAIDGAALWVPPRTAGAAMLDEKELRLSLLEVSGLTRLSAVLGAIRVFVASERGEPHLELRIIGVAPDRQGQGIASALLRPMLQQCDAEAVSAGLMCTKEENLGLYRHFGFEVIAEVRVPDGPTLWQMWRAPATG